MNGLNVGLVKGMYDDRVSIAIFNKHDFVFNGDRDKFMNTLYIKALNVLQQLQMEGVTVIALHTPDEPMTLNIIKGVCAKLGLQFVAVTYSDDIDWGI